MDFDVKTLDFSPGEIKDILISLAVLSFIFSYPEILSSPSFILVSAVGVGLAFIGHELSHRFVARKLGFYSAYKMWPQGLLMAVVLAIVTNGNFVFAAPGAVVFSGYWIMKRPTIKEIGVIGISGTLFNITVMFLSLSLLFATGLPVFTFVARINAWLAIFNLIPFGPLDGRKVMAWSKKMWAIALALAIIGFLMASVF